MNSSTGPSRHTLRSPEDLLALVPFALGFAPSESLVMVGLGASAFHARIDLPRDEPEREGTVEVLLRAAAVNHVDRAAVLAYSEDAEPALAAARALASALAETGVGVLDALWADGSRWWWVEDATGPGTAYDLRSHPITAERVLAGDVALGGREELAASLSTDVRRLAEVEGALEAALAHGPRCRLDDPAQVALESAWVSARLDRYDRDEALPDAADAARLLLALRHGPLRDLAWCRLDRCAASRHVRLWRDLVVRSPSELRAHAAAVLGFVAWLDGDGALAWCAVERCQESRAQHSLAALVAQLLEGAVSPRTWRPLDAAHLAARAGRPEAG